MSAWRIRRLEELFGASDRTLRRRQKWWQEVFAEGPFWVSARGRLRHPIPPGELPRTLLVRFSAAVAGTIAGGDEVA